MTWLDEHRKSEIFASQAEVAVHQGEACRARTLYAEAAAAEENALTQVESGKQRTYGITAVSAASLRFKSGQYDGALALAYRCLAVEWLPPFAWRQLDELVGMTKTEISRAKWENTGVIVSLKEGDQLLDAAPVELLSSKFKHLESFLYRTAEVLHDIPYRTGGKPSQEIRDVYQPWLFQVTSSGCQFGIAVGEPSSNGDMVVEQEPRARVLNRFYDIMRACAESPVAGLRGEISDPRYRGAFLRLARDLAPSRDGYDSLDIKFPRRAYPVVFARNSRDVIAGALRGVAVRALPQAEEPEEVDVNGVLRGVDLERGWIEVLDGSQRVRIKGIGSDVDGMIGPMVNGHVAVQVVRIGGDLQFRGIREAYTGPLVRAR